MRDPVYITSAGKFYPGEPVANDQVEERLGRVGSQPSRLRERVLQQNRIRHRYYAIDANQRTTCSNAQMAAHAARDAVARSTLTLKDIPLLVAATSQGNLPLPGFASMVHGELEMPPCEIASLHGICLSEHVYAAVRDAWGEGTPQARDWANRLLTAIRQEGYAAFDALLGQCLADPAASPTAQAALDKLRQYVSQRQRMVNYPHFETQGWPIGSGPTESMAGVLTARIKGRGRRWDADNIDRVMALQAMEIGDEWEAYWQVQYSTPVLARVA